MAIQTLDQYIENEFSSWFSVSQKKLGRKIDPREGGHYKLEDGGSYYEYACMPLEEVLSVTRQLFAVRDQIETVPEEEFKRLFSSPAISAKYEWGEWQDYHYMFSRRYEELAANKPNLVNVDSFLAGVLRFQDNYSTYVFRDKEIDFNAFAKELKPVFSESEGYSWKTEEPERGEMWSGEGLASFIWLSGETGEASFSLTDSKPQNKVLARFHGNPFNCANFVSRLARYVQANKYAAHFDFLQRQGMIGGIFYDPLWRQLT